MKKFLSLFVALAMVLSLFAGVGARTAKAAVVGDVNGNGTVGMDDALLLAQSIVGIATLTTAQQLAADVNGDGVITMADTLQVAQIVVGVTTPPVTTVTVTVGSPTLSLAVGATGTIVGTPTPTDATITYASSDVAKATVSTTGLVTGVAVGTANITVTAAKTGYTSGTATVTVTVTALPPATIATAAIAGVTAPVTSAIPVTTATATAEYTAAVVWSPAVTTFARGTGYTAWITLTPRTGYTLTGVAANFFTVVGATATNAADSGVVSAIFPATVLPAPVLLSPANDAVLSTLTPTLSWSVVPGATNYEVRIWVAPTSATNLVDQVITGTSYTVPAGLLTSGGRYTWSVCAWNSLGWSVWATVSVSGTEYSPSFTVQAAVKLATPVPTSPEDDMSIWTYMGNIQFQWSSVAGADHYQLWIGLGTSGTQSTNVYNQTVYGTTYSLPQSTLTRGQVYTWSVRADNYASDANSSNWSTDWHFAVTADFQLGLLSPVNYATVFYSPTLIWSPFSGVTNYAVQVYRGEIVQTSARILVEKVYGTSYAIPGLTLTKGETYCWWVIACREEYIDGQLVIFTIATSATYILYTSPY